jgi:hypothetical protein
VKPDHVPPLFQPLDPQPAVKRRFAKMGPPLRRHPPAATDTG